jgi:hypothetical protein
MMKLSDLASIGSLISSAAVLISLVYLALQIRQAERNQRALIHQGRASRMIALTASLIRGSSTDISLLFLGQTRLRMVNTDDIP